MAKDILKHVREEMEFGLDKDPLRVNQRPDIKNIGNEHFEISLSDR